MREGTKIITCKTSTSLSYLLGGLTSFATSFFMSKFPKGYFKKVYISNSLNSTNMRNEDMYKQSTPYLTVEPIFELGDTFIGLQPYWQTTNYWIFKNKKKNYVPILTDSENKISMYTVPSRIKMSYNFTIKLPTVMSAYEMVHYLEQGFETSGYNFINKIRLQAQLPRDIMHSIASTLGYDLNEYNQRDEFNDYLNKHSMSSINEIINLSTGNKEYMYNYNSNLLINYPSRATFDKNIEGLVVKDTTVQYQFSLESWVPSNYILEVPESFESLEEVINDENLDSTYKFNLVLPVDYIKNQIDDKHLIVKKSFIPDVNVEYDILEFDSIMSDELVDVINKLKLYKKDIDKVMEIKVFINNRELIKETYSVDWKDFILKTNQPMSNSTYTLLIYGNLEILNKVSDLIINDKENLIGELEL